MTYKHLRAFIKRISPPIDCSLKNCTVIIDGRSFFKDSYKMSGCNSLLGGEYDRYADFLKNILIPFNESNITCYVIFNGGMEADLEKRKEIHQRVIDNAKNINPDDDNAYCEPIFAKDVWKEVLDELNIKYFVTEHDSWPVMFWVARVLQCPILTRNYEYSLRYVDCISPKSLVHHKDSKEISCQKFINSKVRNKFRVKHNLLPLFYTLLDESAEYFKKLSVIVDCLKPKNLLPKVLRWTRWQADNLEDTLEKINELLTEEEASKFFDAYRKNHELCQYTKSKAAVKHFRQNRVNGNYKIPTPYVNLICNGIFSGSWQIFDVDKEDAMLPALDIIFYGCKCLKFVKEAKIIFIGRQDDVACVWEVDKCSEEIAVNNSDLFKNFIYETMPGFDFKNLEAVPEECWVLIITLVYYQKHQKIDPILAYSMILSYVMMGPVSENIGLIKRCNFISPEITSDAPDKNGLISEDCVAVINSMIDLFYAKNLKRNFNRRTLHTFAEFQHCLQHMNYLNNICGKRIKNTVYHKTINATFAYNMFLKMKEKDATKFIEKRLKKSTVFDCYKRIEEVFVSCMFSVGLDIR